MNKNEFFEEIISAKAVFINAVEESKKIMEDSPADAEAHLHKALISNPFLARTMTKVDHDKVKSTTFLDTIEASFIALGVFDALGTDSDGDTFSDTCDIYWKEFLEYISENKPGYNLSGAVLRGDN